MDLTDKVAFITGSAAGIGKGLAEGLLDKGVKVYLSDVNGELGEATLKEFQAKYGSDRVSFSVLDVTDDKQFQEVFDRAVKTFGRVDIMINNAGIAHENNFDASLLINVGGVIRGTRIAQEHMRTGNNGVGGRIINMASHLAFNSSFMTPTYCATKNAVRAYTTCASMQEDKRKQKVQYAALCPDTMDVGMANTTFQKSQVLPEYWEFFGEVAKTVKKLPIAELVEALMNLLSLENMNGALLMASFDGRKYIKMSYKGNPSFTPGDQPAGLGIELESD